MIDKIMSLLNPLIPAYLSAKGLEKVNPKLKTFFLSAGAAGYGTDQILDFLRNKFEPSGVTEEKERLSKGNLRPDEMAARESIRQSEAIPNALASVANLGGGALGGLGGLALTRGKREKVIEPPREGEHIPGLGQYQGENVPGLGQYQAEHVPGLGQARMEHEPGLGQFRGEHGPQYEPQTMAREARTAALKKHREYKAASAGKQDFLAAMAQLTEDIKRLKGM